MPKMTLAEAQMMYKLWCDAETALATGKSYTIAGRSMTRTDMNVVLERKRYYGRIVDDLENPGVKRRSKVRGITPFDR
ncbi:DUF6148 family protein [Paenibacillus terrae]|uniref:Uncharacterized protein n=1 Tax=Paenibacillus terrae TaxID=159743 RepID=A0A0D7X428_9BACL|nr:DUF6148 family protein [Paenibacillus terrae]KJD45989.1 hypothetical protein QD47_08370 [Paenibacillus terrae]